MHNKENFLCRICGLRQDEMPWGEDGRSPSFNICHCCGVEFGYEDSTLIAIKFYRDDWLKNGAKWFKPKAKPVNWNLEKQLASIPEIYK